MLPIANKPSQMQGMDRKYDGHPWCKVITTNIKNSFGLNFRKAHCLSHLWCLHDDYENCMHIGSCNENFWCDECTHILVVVQMALCPSTSSFPCKFCHFTPPCVVDCLGWIYYVMHWLPTITRATIHFGVHKHLMADGKCREFMDKTIRLEVDYTPNANILVISLGVNKTFLPTHLLNDSGDGILELMNGEQLE